MRIAVVVPHMFMHEEVLSKVIFAPGFLAIDLCLELKELGHQVTFFSPGYILKDVENCNADLSYFKWELEQRKYGYVELLKKHPLTFITLARQAQSELIAKAFNMANDGEFDIVHVYTNEEEIALQFSGFCKVPVVFTHHEPFNYLAKYRNSFSRFKHKNWVSLSLAQRKSIAKDTNWVGNVYNGIPADKFVSSCEGKKEYLAYFGRIIQPKGVHLAIAAAQKAGKKLKIAGKHYGDFGNDSYWKEKIKPEIDGKQIEYVGFIHSDKEKEDFLRNAEALLMPSLWDEPFGMVSIEALACGTPVIALANGAIPEIIQNGINGLLVEPKKLLDGNGEMILDEDSVVNEFVEKIKSIKNIDRKICRKSFEERFTSEEMAKEYERIYTEIINGNNN